MAGEVARESWRPVRPHPGHKDGLKSFDSLVPDADWFWFSLQRLCVPECCGLAAYDFTAESVAWACGWGTAKPAENDWRDDKPGDPEEPAVALRGAADALRAMGAQAASASLFNDILTSESYANLFDYLAAQATPSPTSH